MSMRTIDIPGNAITGVPSDTAKLSGVGFYVGGAGNVAVMPFEQEGAASPTAVTFTAPPVGTVIRMNFSRLMNTGTTATNIVVFTQ